MPRPLCPKCQVEYRKKQTGVFVIEMAEGIGPYKIWAADLYQCLGCNTELVADYGNGPIAEHYQVGFQEKLKRIEGTAFRMYERVNQGENR